MERFTVSWDNNKVDNIKEMLQALKDNVPEYRGWSLASLGGELLARSLNKELNGRGVDMPPIEKSQTG